MHLGCERHLVLSAMCHRARQHHWALLLTSCRRPPSAFSPRLAPSASGSTTSNSSQPKKLRGAWRYTAWAVSSSRQTRHLAQAGGCVPSKPCLLSWSVA